MDEFSIHTIITDSSSIGRTDETAKILKEALHVSEEIEYMPELGDSLQRTEEEFYELESLPNDFLRDQSDLLNQLPTQQFIEEMRGTISKLIHGDDDRIQLVYDSGEKGINDLYGIHSKRLLLLHTGEPQKYCEVF